MFRKSGWIKYIEKEYLEISLINALFAAFSRNLLFSANEKMPTEYNATNRLSLYE